MDRFKEMILTNIEKGRITKFSDCICAAIGWHAALGDKYLSVELIEWFFELIDDGKLLN